MIAGSVASSELIQSHALWDDYYEAIHGAYSSLRETFLHSGLTQDDIASRLGIDKSRVSKILNGKENLTVKTMSHFGTALECRVVISYVPYASLGYNNTFRQTERVQGFSISAGTPNTQVFEFKLG
jgi:DNA-binding Xre family transcriptional regulator